MRLVTRSAQYDYEGYCWWCGDVANSREHKWKKSELTAIYGSANSESYPLTWVDDDGRSKLIQGPNSVLVKFESSLCQNCNNSKSQPFDHAYDLWIKYLVANYEQLIEQRVIDLRVIVDPAEYETFRLNLAKYFTKHICCRIADGSAAKVPDSVIAFLDGKSEDSRFVWSEICLNKLALEHHDARRYRLGMSRTVGDFHGEGTALTSLKGALLHGALQIVWDINLDPGRDDDGNGILTNDLHPLRVIDEDLYTHQFLVFDSDNSLGEKLSP